MASYSAKKCSKKQKGGGKSKGQVQSERTPSGQSWNNLNNKINNAVFSYNCMMMENVDILNKIRSLIFFQFSII